MTDTPSRRSVLSALATGAVAATAGCGQASPATETTDSRTATDTATRTRTATDTATEACLEPVGCLSFDAPPERWVANAGIYCDMGVALGLTDRLVAIGSPRRFYTGYYDELPGVSLNKSEYLALSRGTRMPKESFYAADADVHLIDPVWLRNTFGWTERDVEEIATNVGPFFGNYIRERQDAWHDYRYYTLWEAFEQVATLFDRRTRYEQLASVSRELTETIKGRLPDTKPETLLLRPQGVPPQSFFPQYIDDSVSDRQWNVVEVDDVLAGSDIPEWGVRIGYEELADLDPEVIVMETQFADDFVLDEQSFREYTLGFMRDHPVGRDVAAVENGRVYAGGINYQGPLISLFQTERAAQIAYPDEFGGEALFDRETVGEIVTGNRG
jgi:iron complex transport system substrate-binding protein